LASPQRGPFGKRKAHPSFDGVDGDLPEAQYAQGHKIYPYLLRGPRVDRPNQVWCADITCLPMRRGFLYLVAIMDRHTRKVLAWRISNTPPLGDFTNHLPVNGKAGFCVEALKRPSIASVRQKSSTRIRAASSRSLFGRTG
jgi:hypothetical protein